jgi:hypothetical protein
MSKPVLYVLSTLVLLALPVVAAPAVAAPAGDPRGELTPASALDLAALFSAPACGTANAVSIGLPPRTPAISFTCGSCSDGGCDGRRSGDFCGWQAGQKAYCLLQLTPCSGGGYHCICNIP